jgi:hypothetical protein
MSGPVAAPAGSLPITYPAGAVLVRALVRNALASHLAGKLSPLPVWRTRLLAVEPGQMPLVLVYAMSERKQLISGAAGAFYFQTSVAIVVQAKIEAEDEAGAEAALDALNLALEESIFRVRNGDGWMQPHWLPANVECSTRITMEGERPLGELSLTFDVEVAAESFEPVITDVLNTINLRIDLIDPFDRLGTYAAQPSAPPRVAGPDGRTEAGAIITNLNT